MAQRRYIRTAKSNADQASKASLSDFLKWTVRDLGLDDKNTTAIHDMHGFQLTLNNLYAYQFNLAPKDVQQAIDQMGEAYKALSDAVANFDKALQTNNLKDKAEATLAAF